MSNMENVLSQFNRNRPFTINDFDMSNRLGCGALGQVYKVRLRETKSIMALKMIKKTNITTPEEFNFIKREIEIHSHLKNENIIKLFSYFHDNERLYIMLEYCRYGSLDSILCKEGPFKNIISATYIYQLTNALKYLHEKKVIHRDVKPENALICKSGQLKLGDFGCCVHHKGGQRLTQTGTLDYLAPEILSGANHDVKVDVWGCGVFLFEMLVGLPPFYSDNRHDTMDKIRNLQLRFPNFLDPSAETLIINILRLNATLRPTAAEVFNSDFVTKYAEKSLVECKAIQPILKKIRENNDKPIMK